MLFRSNDTATTEIYTGSYTLSLHDALPITRAQTARGSRLAITGGGSWFADSSALKMRLAYCCFVQLGKGLDLRVSGG